MADKKAESKVVLDREYIVPLREGWLKVPKYKRGRKVVKTLKEFLVKHMKVYDRDLSKIKLDVDLNNEMRFRGEKKPPARIKVRAVKYDDEIVRVSLVDLPDVLKFKKSRELKEKAKKLEKPKAEKAVEDKKEDKVEKSETAVSASKDAEGQKMVALIPSYRNDILHKIDDEWHIFEVKSTNSVKEEHIGLFVENVVG